LKRREAEIEELKENSSQTEKKLRHQHQIERAQITEAHERTIAELRNQCEQHRGDVQKLSAAMSEIEGKLGRLRGRFAELQKEKHRGDGEIESQRAQFEREKKLIETASVARGLETDSRNLAKLGEIKAKFENEKREIFGYVADAFRGFYKAAEQIDERTFRSVIDKTKEELQRLTVSEEEIKRLLGAFEGQSAHEVVAQLVIERKQL
jgi:chromosome segregation ATPase